MPHKKFVLAYYNGPLGCLIDTRKALGILLVHEIHDSRLRVFLFKWIAALVLLLGAGLRGFNLMPIFLALVLFSVTIALCAFFFRLDSEDLFLKFALEDEEFYDLATQAAPSAFSTILTPPSLSQQKGPLFGTGRCPCAILNPHPLLKMACEPSIEPFYRHY